jgi:HD-GYP domain-containing protein (c-di-GMP phosphodiesterase class II)
MNDNVWDSLLKALAKFDDFFAESKTELFVDRQKIVRKRTIPNSILQVQRLFQDKEEIIKPHEIFGHDLDESDLSNILWKKSMLSIKSASRKIDYFVNCSLSLNESTYKFEIEESNTNITSNLKNKQILFEEEREYKSYLMRDDIENIIRIISNHLIKEIKDQK